MITEVLFFVFAIVAVAGAVNLLAQSHPINSALSLIVVMGSLAAIYMLLGAEFVAAVQVIVYAGAVMVLFVFVIMLLNAGREESDDIGSRVAKIFGYPAVAIGGGALVWVLATGATASRGVQLGTFYGGTQDIGRLLFRDFLLPFEVTSVLILIAIMGAVVLGRRGEE